MLLKTQNLKKDRLTRSAEKAVGQVLGNFIAIKTGTIEAGEQIPLPRYQDGKQASRNEVHYLVSPAEVPTSLTYIATSGSFYVKCHVDKRGFVHASLWQQSGTGAGIEMVGENTYEELRKQFEREGITSVTGAENITAQQMKVLSKHLLINYMVIALRSQKG